MRRQGIVNYGEHGRTFPNPARQRRLLIRPTSEFQIIPGKVHLFMSPHREPSTDSDHCSSPRHSPNESACPFQGATGLQGAWLTAISIPHSGSGGDAEVDQGRLRTVDAVIRGVQRFVKTEPSTRSLGRLQRRVHESLTAPGHDGCDNMRCGHAESDDAAGAVESSARIRLPRWSCSSGAGVVSCAIAQEGSRWQCGLVGWRSLKGDS